MSAEQEEHEFMQDLRRETSLEIHVNNTGGCQPLESAEAEFYAAVKAAAAGIGCVSIMRDLGVVLQQQGVKVRAKGLSDGIDSPSLEIKLGATAGRAIATRRGAGRIRHIATPTVWLQRLVINGDIKMTRVGGSDNCAEQAHEVLRNAFCGRPEQYCTPTEFFSTSIPMSNETSGSPHSATPRHDQRLELGMENLYGDTRRTLRVATWLGQQRRKQV